ncbi:signal peptidase I [Brevibacillus sp. NRS-1366]|uniref:signal peptidase I n=1 Tax=Brevibacillus sp. NRS-1366 TaxID=3233899 RepID=UPI003D1D109A
MGILVVKRVGTVLLVLFILLNLFLYASSRWNSDGMPGIGGWRVLSVLTGSMAPAINTGDMVIVTRYSNDVPRAGDVVTYWRDDQFHSLITHRVMQRLENGYLQTKGDANLETDGGWTDPNRLVGKVVFTIPFAAYVQQLIKEPLSMLVIFTGFFVYIIYSQRRPKNRPDSMQTDTIEGELS